MKHLEYLGAGVALLLISTALMGTIVGLGYLAETALMGILTGLEYLAKTHPYVSGVVIFFIVTYFMGRVRTHVGRN